MHAAFLSGRRTRLGTDYGFLSARESRAAGDDATFRGTAASVQDRNSGLVVSLGATEEVRYQVYALAADFAASLRIGERELTLALPAKVIDGDKTMEPMATPVQGQVEITTTGFGVRLRQGEESPMAGHSYRPFRVVRSSQRHFGIIDLRTDRGQQGCVGPP